MSAARLFLSAGRGSWLDVFPAARSAQRRLHARAAAIPDPTLRADALASHRDKRSNSEGLAALALLAPAEGRDRIVRSQVAYQLMLDYLDGVSERPCRDPIASGLRLHRAFEVALDPAAEHADYLNQVQPEIAGCAETSRFFITGVRLSTMLKCTGDRTILPASIFE